MPVYLGTQRVAVRGGIQASQGGSTPKLEDTKYVTPDKNSHTITYGSGYDGLSKVVVYPIPDSYIKPASTLSTKTWTPGSENQTIAAGTYLTGAQTIKGDSNLIADNIKSGVKIFDVTGSYVGNVSSGDGNGIIPTYTQTTKEWTPTISDQFIEAGTYCEGRQVIKGDANLKSGNIKSGVSIFNVIGTYDLPTIGLSNEGSAEHLLSGKQLLDTNYETVTGSMPNNNAMTGTISTKAGTVTIPKGYHNGNGKVSISSSEQEKIIASNIKSGTTILGVTGNYNGPDNAIVPTKTLGTTTYIPTTAEMKIAAGTYCEGDQIIQGDPDLKAENIKSGVTIFNIAGNYTGPEGNVVPTTTLGTKTWTPTTSTQTIAAGTYCEGAQTIAAIPSDYVKPTSTKAAGTYTPGLENQTIAAGTYLTGAQTIAGDPDLIASNIKSGVTIFNVTGTYTGSSSSSSGIKINKATAQNVTVSGSYGSSISIKYSQNEPIPVVSADGTSITLGFTSSTDISRVSASTDLRVLSNTYALVSSTGYNSTSACYYIPQSSTCTFQSGTGMTSTSKLTIPSAQKVTMSLS